MTLRKFSCARSRHILISYMTLCKTAELEDHGGKVLYHASIYSTYLINDSIKYYPHAHGNLPACQQIFPSPCVILKRFTLGNVGWVFETMFVSTLLILLADQECHHSIMYQLLVL